MRPDTQEFIEQWAILLGFGAGFFVIAMIAMSIAEGIYIMNRKLKYARNIAIGMAAGAALETFTTAVRLFMPYPIRVFTSMIQGAVVGGLYTLGEEQKAEVDKVIKEAATKGVDEAFATDAWLGIFGKKEKIPPLGRN